MWNSNWFYSSADTQKHKFVITILNTPYPSPPILLTLTRKCFNLLFIYCIFLQSTLDTSVHQWILKPFLKPLKNEYTHFLLFSLIVLYKKRMSKHELQIWKMYGSYDSYIHTRVDMVGTNHNKVLTQWRHMPMGQFRANIFLIQITSTYFWASEVFKNQRF